MKTLTIIGAGGTGHAMAAYFTLCGLEVCFCDLPAYRERLDAIREKGGIDLTGNGGKKGLAMPALVTDSFEEAMGFSHRVFVCVPAPRHEEIAEACAPFVTDQHVFCICPGNLGSPVFKRVFGKRRKEVLLSELAGNLGSCRLIAPAEAVIALPVGPKAVAAYPASRTQEVIEAFSDVIGMTAAGHIFEAALNGPNTVIHLAGSILSAAQIERAGSRFRFFTDGVSEAVQTCIAAVEKERDAVLEAMGFKIYESYADFIGEIRDPVNHPELDVFRQLDGPDSLKHRYIHEDALASDALLLSLGKTYGVPTPVLESFMTIASAINGIDYEAEGRNLANLGLSGLTKEDLIAVLCGTDLGQESKE